MSKQQLNKLQNYRRTGTILNPRQNFIAHRNKARQVEVDREIENSSQEMRVKSTHSLAIGKIIRSQFSLIVVIFFFGCLLIKLLINLYEIFSRC